MTLARFPVRQTLRLVALAAVLSLGAAHADEYGDVSQLLRTGRLPEALSKADQFLAGKPRDPQMRYFKGLVQRDSGRQAEAIATFTQLNEDFPELPEPYNALAVIHAAQVIERRLREDAVFRATVERLERLLERQG